jgi:hypothetical protein
MILLRLLGQNLLELFLLQLSLLVLEGVVVVELMEMTSKGEVVVEGEYLLEDFIMLMTYLPL